MLSVAIDQVDPDRQDGLREVVDLEGLQSFIADLPFVALVRQCPMASVLQVFAATCIVYYVPCLQVQTVSEFDQMFASLCSKGSTSLCPGKGGSK